MSSEEFSPISVASLKHLWTNLTTQGVAQDGYSLAIECRWCNANDDEKHLKLALALANDRLFVKQVGSNLIKDDVLPTVAYLPPFAGIVSRENKMSAADRRAMIGRGLAGGIIRNLILDLQTENERKRAALKAGRKKIKNSDLAALRREDPWEILQTTMAKTFGVQLTVEPFNEIFHTAIKVQCIKGELEGTTFKRYKKFKPRDLMAEGSGFLQWLSVYVLALSPNVRTLLLDEPDAHLHPSLQTQLVQALEDIVASSGKQVLLATHSTEILRWAEPSSVLEFSRKGVGYLVEPKQKISLFLGLGSQYSPKLDPLRKHKRMIIVENRSDARLLEAWAGRANMRWPGNIVIWPWTGSSRERKNLFLQLREEIPDLRVISIRDRDDQELNTVDQDTLNDKSFNGGGPDFFVRVWRRRHIENYLLCPSAIARVANRDIEEVEAFLAEHALIIPDSFAQKEVPAALLDARGKELFSEITKRFRVERLEIASAMAIDEVCDDVKELLRQIGDMCR